MHKPASYNERANSTLSNFLYSPGKRTKNSASLLGRVSATQSIHTNIKMNTRSRTYLPAIDESPTKSEVVLELLIQSKLMPEALGLEETDVVLDQAFMPKLSKSC